MMFEIQGNTGTILREISDFRCMISPSSWIVLRGHVHVSVKGMIGAQYRGIADKVVTKSGRAGR